MEGRAPNSDEILAIRIAAAASEGVGARCILEFYKGSSRMESLLRLCEHHLQYVPQGLWRLYKDVCGEDREKFERAWDSIASDPNAKGYCERAQREVILMKYLAKA